MVYKITEYQKLVFYQFVGDASKSGSAQLQIKKNQTLGKNNSWVDGKKSRKTIAWEMKTLI